MRCSLFGIGTNGYDGFVINLKLQPNYDYSEKQRYAFVPIPKRLHLIWIGDENKAPHAAIESWRSAHPSWEFRVWGNDELERMPWAAKHQIGLFKASGHFEGIADLMRYEILFHEGGVYADADSTCLRPLDDWLLDTRLFACWESEQYRPGLVANSFIGAMIKHPAMKAMVDATAMLSEPVWQRNLTRPYWNGRLRFHYRCVPPHRSTGPELFTKIVLPFCPESAVILPSLLFLPEHFAGEGVRPSSLSYAAHHWGTTNKLYGKL